jgi:hypothetical protein
VAATTVVRFPLTLAENVGLLVVAQMPGARSRQGPGPARMRHAGVKTLMRRWSRRRQIQTAGDTDTASEIQVYVVQTHPGGGGGGGAGGGFGPVSPSVASICPGSLGVPCGCCLGACARAACSTSLTLSLWVPLPTSCLPARLDGWKNRWH